MGSTAIILQQRIPTWSDVWDLVHYTKFNLPGWASEPLLWICTSIIAISILFSVVLLIALYSYRFRTQYRLRRRRELEKSYLLLLTGIIFDEPEEGVEQSKAKLVRHFRNIYLDDSFNRKILRKQLLTLHRNFSGSACTILRNLYLELQLEKESLKKLKSPMVNKRIQAIRELSRMHVHAASDRIRKLTRHSNRLLRNEAQLAMLELDKENAFSFLDDNLQHLSEWDQMNLETTAHRTQGLVIPDFTKWFYEPNPSVVQFCIRMCVQNNQFEASDGLIKLLSSSEEKVVRQSIQALGELMIDDAVPSLISLYRKKQVAFGSDILKTLSKIGGDQVIRFLQNRYEEGNDQEAFEAASALKYTGEAGMMLLEKAGAHAANRSSLIAQHLLNPYLQP